MKILNFKFENFSSLALHIQENRFQHEKSLLIQFFDGRNDEVLFEQMAQKLSSLLPNATILGVTTAGEILEGVMLEHSVTLSFCAFAKTQLISLYSDSCDFEGGERIVSILPQAGVKAAIFFGERVHGTPENFLNGIASARKDLILAGGVASSYKHDSFNALISLNDKVFKKGAVGVALQSESLHVFNHWKLNWDPIGKPMTVTKVHNNTVYELDSQPILDVVRQYFGDDSIIGSPPSVIKFPLIKVLDGVNVARPAIRLLDDGLVFAGSLHVGDKVRFSIANIDAILKDNNPYIFKKPEAIWIYSCVGRKTYLGNILENEFKTYQTVAPVSGFFTFGEFFKTSDCTIMLNFTTTILALSEEENMELLPPPPPVNLDELEQGIAVMSRLTNSVVEELEQTIEALDAYKIALDSNSIVSKTSTKGIITYVNDLFVDISGYTKEELIGKPHNITHHENMPSFVFEELWTVVMQGKIWKGMITNKTKSGEAYYTETTAVPLFNENKNVIEVISTQNDLTKVIKQQQQIQKQTLDQLTGLPNRVKLFDDLEESTNPNIALVNIDNFGEINRFYGFESGNTLLKEFTKTLQYILKSSSYALYKLDADNLIIFDKEGDVSTFCRTIEETISKIHAHEFLSELQRITIRISVGIATKKLQILSRAEEALKQARLKNCGWLLSDERAEEIHLKNFQMLHSLKNAIENDRIVPYYQAIVNVKTRKIEKYESLMRLIDENGKIYTPFFFLEVAKKSKYYPHLTRIMIEKTLFDFAGRKEDFTINLSAEDIEDEGTIAFIKNAISHYPDPSRIIFELTETEAIKDYQIITAFIRTVKRLGVKIAIDDFGSGYSNFAYLAKFNADILKIDGTLIKTITDDNNSYQIVATINDFAKRLGMQTVAEFVFNQETDQIVKALHIDFAQGYYHAEPLPLETGA